MTPITTREIRKLRYRNVEEGYCRVYYTAPGKQADWLYCWQMDGEPEDGFTLYLCTLEGEPLVPIADDDGRHRIKTEIPKGQTRIEFELAAFLIGMRK